MENSLVDRFRPHFVPIALALAGVMFLIFGLVSLTTHKDKGGEITFEVASDVSPLAKEAENKRLVVDVSGAVEKPGVYELPFDARVQDALIAAGGMNEDADRDAVAKSFNLAAKLTDGGKLYVPAVGESVAGVSTVGNSGGLASEGTININTASASDLDELPGVGPATADKIIANRPYASVEELVSKKAVGQKVFENIKEKVTVY